MGSVIAAVVLLGLLALLLATRLWELYEGEQRSHQITLDALADAVSREAGAFERGIQLGEGLRHFSIHVGEGGDVVVVPVIEGREVGCAER